MLLSVPCVLLLEATFAPIVLFSGVTGVVAGLLQWMFKRLWLTVVVGPPMATAAWFALTLPLALQDQWLGLAEEWPFMVHATAVCMAIAIPVTAAVAGVMRHGTERPMLDQ